MSTATPIAAMPVAAHTESPVQVAAISSSSVAELVQRISAEVEAAAERVDSLQADADEVFLRREERFVRFSAVADRIQSILLPRLEAFRQVDVFSDTTQSVTSELQGTAPNAVHGRTTTLTIPHSDKRPAPMELSFCVGHDDSLENVVLAYRVQILPIFIKFDNHDQFTVPVDQPNEKAIAAWIDDKLIGFTRLYFEVYFHEEYQKQIVETDPVMSVRFPRAFAAAKSEHQKRTYYFFTMKSFARFEMDPSQYARDQSPSQ